MSHAKLTFYVRLTFSQACADSSSFRASTDSTRKSLNVRWSWRLSSYVHMQSVLNRSPSCPDLCLFRSWRSRSLNENKRCAPGKGGSAFFKVWLRKHMPRETVHWNVDGKLRVGVLEIACLSKFWANLEGTIAVHAKASEISQQYVQHAFLWHIHFENCY